MPRIAKIAVSLGTLAAFSALTGCVTYPTGPSLPAMMGSTRNPDQFRADDAACRSTAEAAIGGTPQQRANDSAVQSAAVGTLIGAALGAAVGGGDGAAVGAAGGLAMGSAIGADNANRSGYYAQRGYDAAYYQCMYSRGHQVPDWAVQRRGMVEAPAYAAPAPANTGVPPDYVPLRRSYPPPPPPE